MQDRQPAMMKRLLERLLAARARRDREERFSEAWHAADAEMHEIERAIFRVPADHPSADAVASVGGAPTPIHGRARPRADRRADDRRAVDDDLRARRRFEAEQVG
jgi:hypothetical protein